jgi:lipopolysaccharide export system permease protein
VKHAAVHAFLQEGVFTNVEGATVLVEDISDDRRSFRNVFVHKHTADGDSRVIAAPYARLEHDPNRAPYVTFFLGTDMRVPVDQAHSLEPAEVLSFETFSAPVGDEGMAAFRSRGDDERELMLIELWRHRNASPAEIDPDDLAAELHGRLVRIASVAIVPLLAVPFALARKRTAQPLRIAAGVITLVAYNEMLQVGENLVEAGTVGPFLVLWLPFIVLSVGCFAAILVVALWPRLSYLPWRAARV